ncbi:unnamed protein product, partial [Prorocentrum cordatum]
NVVKILKDPAFSGTSEKKSASSAVTELTPKVIQHDSEGAFLTSHETTAVAGKATEVKTIPRHTWAEKSAAMDEEKVAKNVLERTMASAHHHLLCETMPISMSVHGNVVKACATADIGIGGLIVPLWFQGNTSMVMGSSGAQTRAKAVAAEVSWSLPVTSAEAKCGLGVGNQISKKICVQRELKLPKATQEESMNSANAAMVMEKLTQVVASEFSRVKEAKGNANACVVTYAVTLPCIVNTVAVKAGQEI